MTAQNPFFSRKFVLTLVSLVFGGVGFFMGKVSSGGFFTFVSVMMATYSAANVIQSATTPKNDATTTPAPAVQ